MKITLKNNEFRVVLTGGGTGGHLYPLLAVNDAFAEFKNITIETYYVGPLKQFKKEIEARGVKFKMIFGPKIRRYFSLKNFVDLFIFPINFCLACVRMYFLMPDAVFSKGGSGSFEVILAAKFFAIPIFIHESDSTPSLSTELAARLAKKIFTSFQKTADFLKNYSEKIILAGNPARSGFFNIAPDDSNPHFDLENSPTIFVIGGSQGAAIINDFILNNLKELLKSFQIIHQTGPLNFANFQKEAKAALNNLKPEIKKRYKYFPYLNEKEYISAMAFADLIIARAGAGTIFELAAAKKPSILIPLSYSAQNHQKYNAYEYADAGGAVIIEEANLSPHIIIEKAEEIINTKLGKKMAENSQKFSRPEAAKIIAQEILSGL